MKSPRSTNRGASSGQRLGNTVADDARSCPFACLQGGRLETLYDKSGAPQATRCLDCDAAVTRLGWLAELDRAAGSRS